MVRAMRYSRPTVWLFPFALCASWGLTHCSSSSNGSVAKDAGAKGGSTQEPEGGFPSGDDTTAPDAGGFTMTGDGSTPAQGSSDAGTDANGGPPGTPVPEGGAPSDPGSVVCNGAPCAVNSGYSCCVTTADDGGPKETCNPPNTGCTGLTIFCNEAADCNGGVCCQQIKGIAVAGSTSCTSSSACTGVGMQTFQTCRTNSECGAADGGGVPGRCIPQTCTNGLPMRTLAIEACAVSQGLGDMTGGPLISCTAN
jgi:hypothetical protein